jgi:hypothetical protein
LEKSSRSTSSLECPYCKSRANLVTGLKIYPHRKDLSDKFFYLCQPCDAYVGCHPRSKTPLGTLANGSLRKLRAYAHEFFDPLWKNKIFKTRTKAYKWLSEQMGTTIDDTHIAMFNEEQCKKVIEKVREYKYKLKK